MSISFQFIAFTVLLSITFSCVTDQSGFADAMDASIGDQKNPAAASAAERLTRGNNGGRTLPDGLQLAHEVNNVGGEICPQCAAARAASGGDVPATSNGGNGKDPMYTVSLRNYPGPSKGCIPVSKVSTSEANSLMASQNVSIQNATDLEVRTLGAGLMRIQQLNGGPLSSGMGPKINGGPYPFIVRSGVESSGQRADHIQIMKKKSESVVQYVHEYGHLVGNNGGYAAYQSYTGGSKCHITNYAMKSDNEQFAEVFGAFVTEPSSLLNNSRSPAACKKAYEFFAGKFFKNGNRVKECL